MANVRRVLARLGIEVAEEKRDELWALCPNPEHEDESPSWSIRYGGEKHGLHRCFSCGFSGNLEGLVILLLKLNDGEWDGGALAAKEWLSSDAVAEPAREMPPTIEVRSVMGAAGAPFRLPEGVDLSPVASWPTPPRRYVVEARGIPEEQADRWGLGYGAWGRLSGRIAIVVRDKDGEAASYMARAYGQAAKKYLYPRKEERADHDVVFGEAHWPARAARGAVLVAEGALKALALERALGLPVAALGGNRIRPMHAIKLRTFGRVVYVRDGGGPGEEAWLDVRASLGRHSGLCCVSLPEGEDADSLALKDMGELRRRLAAALGGAIS